MAQRHARRTRPWSSSSRWTAARPPSTVRTPGASIGGTKRSLGPPAGEDRDPAREVRFAQAEAQAASGADEARAARLPRAEDESPLGPGGALQQRQPADATGGAVQAGDQPGQAIPLIELAKESYREVLRNDPAQWTRATTSSARSACCPTPTKPTSRRPRAPAMPSAPQPRCAAIRPACHEAPRRRARDVAARCRSLAARRRGAGAVRELPAPEPRTSTNRCSSTSWCST